MAKFESSEGRYERDILIIEGGADGTLIGKLRWLARNKPALTVQEPYLVCSPSAPMAQI
jgi:hypothetical protein